MRKVDIFVRDRIIRVKYEHQNKVKEHEWEDCQNLTQKFLLRLDKINKCDNLESNCLFSKKSDSAASRTDFLKSGTGATKPTIIVLHQEGRESTTYRIVLVSLQALAWTGAIKLKNSL